MDLRESITLVEKMEMTKLDILNLYKFSKYFSSFNELGKFLDESSYIIAFELVNTEFNKFEVKRIFENQFKEIFKFPGTIPQDFTNKIATLLLDNVFADYDMIDILEKMHQDYRNEVEQYYEITDYEDTDDHEDNLKKPEEMMSDVVNEMTLRIRNALGELYFAVLDAFSDKD